MQKERLFYPHRAPIKPDYGLLDCRLPDGCYFDDRLPFDLPQHVENELPDVWQGRPGEHRQEEVYGLYTNLKT